MHKYSIAALAWLPLLGLAVSTYGQTDVAVVLAQDTKGTPDERAAQLIKQMTLAEKISLLSGNQFVTHAIPRLGIESFTMADGPNGVRNGPGNPAPPGCAFPCGVALAATWDPAMADAYGKAVGLEDRARGVNFQLGPGLNICRVPVNGRNFEYFGEDPYLASIIAAHWVKSCSAQGSVPTIKHFAANNQENNRNSVDAEVDERTMQEIYLPAFKRAVTEGGISAIMCSYNRLNGSYASNNDWLLNQTLKNQWGFKGLVMSDWGASHDVTDVARGLDLEMPTGQNLNAQKIDAALGAGTIKQSDIDHAVQRFLRTAAAQGWLDRGWQQKNPNLPLDSADSAKTALDIAQAAIVLLKNEGHVLPLDRSKVKTILVVGPNATAPDGQMQGNIGGGGSGAVTPSPNRFVEADYLKGIIKAAGDNVKVIYLPMPGGGQVAGRGGRRGFAVPAPLTPEEQAMYDTLSNAKTATGEAGVTLTVQVTGAGDPVTIPPSTQMGINTTWQAGQLPFGVPAGRDATFTWAGVVTPPQDIDYEIRAAGTTSIMLDGRTIAPGDIVHLPRGKATSIQIVAQAMANPPAGRRGGRGGFGAPGGPGGFGGGLAIRAGFFPPAIPDLSAAATADAVIVCMGLNSGSEAEGRDRAFELPAIQQYLAEKAGQLNPHTIVITNAGAAVGMTHWAPHAAVILHAWYLGQEGGIAIGNVLFGEVNPSGHLASTFDKNFEDNPAFAYYPGTTAPGATYPVEPYTEGIFYGYRGYDKAGKEPLYPFGYGLSYTTFDLSNMKIEASGAEVKVALDLKNTGSRAGAEVVQVYVGERNCPLARPQRELKGFSKVSLAPGQTQRVEITLPRDAFAYWSPAKKDWTVDAGNTFTIEAGTSEHDLPLHDTVVVK